MTMSCLARLATALALALALACASASAAATPLLDAPFGDHAVLQRDRPIPLWGQAPAGTDVRVRMGAHEARTRSADDGRWQLHLPAMPAGGPYRLDIHAGSATQQLQDVLVGDVWLCSGQSNMELQVHRSLDSRSEIASAGNPKLRLLQVDKQASRLPLARFARAPQWQAADPDSVRDFSAACYYFGRELQAATGVPIGLIHASWGGTRIQAWMSADAMQTLGGYAAQLEVLAQRESDPEQAIAGWGALWEAWWQAQPAAVSDPAPWQREEAMGWTNVDPSARWIDPAQAQAVGMQWYRASVELTPAQAAQRATLQLGPVDEVDMTWINGVAVGSDAGSDAPRAYPIAAGRLRAGSNPVVVNVLNTYREGGISGPATRQALLLADGTRVPLQHWQTRSVAAATGTPPAAPWMATSGLSALYNGMISPLAGYGLRGAVWYQGESNTFQAAQYAGLLSAYRDDLRRHFGEALPLLVVQLANYGAAPVRPGDSEWARLREAQRNVVADDPHSGLAVAIDLGERGDIHPANKQDVGRRLARAARHVVYGQALAPSGPVPTQAHRVGSEVRVSFDQVSGALVAYGGTGPVGFELCGVDPNSCRYATARIEGNAVLLRADEVAGAQHVRYGWADSPVVTLYDSDGLPAGPFELTIQ